MLAAGLNLIVDWNEMTDRKAELLQMKAMGYADKLGPEESHPLYTGYNPHY